MKKRKFNARAMKRFTTEPKVVHEAKPIDLITQYNRMRSIATDIYNSDFFMISSKADQKKIEASIACISATMISMIGMEAIENSHDCLPDDSGDGISTDKDSYDAIKKMANSVYGATGNMQKAAQKYTDTDHAPSSIVARNRKILSELGTKSPMQIMDECLIHTDKPDEDPSFSPLLRSIALGNEYDEVTDDDSDGDEVIDYSEVDLGNFIDGPFYGQQYHDICRRYGFDTSNTLKQIEKLASQQYIQMINLVDAVDSQNEITADKYTLEPGSVFFVTNKNDESRSPVFMLIYAQPYTKVRSSDISKFSFEITPEHHTEESTNLEDSDKDDYDVDFGNFADGPFYSDWYRHICQLNGFNIDETLKRIVKAASDHTVSKLNLVGVVSDKHDIKSDDKYYPKPGDVFFVTNRENDKDPVFVLICAKSHIERFNIDKVSVEIKPVELEESTKTNYIDFVGSDAYFNIGKVHLNPNTVIDLDATLEKIKDEARVYGIDTITFVDTIGNSLDIYTKGKYTLEPGSLFCHRGNGWLNFMLILKDKNTPDTVRFIWPVEKSEENASQDDIEFVGADAYYSISKVHSNSNDVIDLDATLSAIKANAKEFGIKTVTFVDTITDSLLAHFNGEYSMEAGSLFCVKDDDWTHFLLITKSGNLMSDIRVQYIYPVMTKKDDSEEDDIEFIGIDDYYNIDKTCPNSTIIDLDATLAKIKEMAKEKGIKTITFVDSIDTRSEIFNKNKYSLEIGSLFFVKKCINLMNFILVTETGDTPSDTRVQVIKSVVIKKDDPEGKSDSNKDGSHDVVDAEVEFEYTPYESCYINDLATSSFMAKDDIEFIGIDDYYNIDRAYSNSTIIDLDATLAKIKERARAKNIKTITFAGTIKGFYEIFYKGKNFQTGSLHYIKNDGRPRFILITGTIDYVNLPQYEHIDPVVVSKKDDSEDESDSKEDGIEVVEAEDEIVDSDEASSDYVINDQYADADTSELHPDIYTKVAFPIFMKPTDTGTDVSFAQICDLYDFDISETVKRIKNAAYLEKIEKVNYVDSFQMFDDIFKTEMSIRYGYHDGSLFLVRESTKGKLDPCFVILRKVHDDSYYDAYLYRINPIMRPAKIHGIKKIDIIDTYADGDVRIANDLKNFIDIDHSYKLKEVCDKRNYDYDRISSCLKGVTVIIGGGTRLTFEGTVRSINSIILVDPVVAYNTCSVFFVSDFVCCEEEAYFVIYMPITGKTKNGYNFRLYRIYPIPNLNQDPNTDSQDDSNVREINQFTAIYRANLEVSEADKDAYMKVEFSLINHSANRAIDSLQNICYTWKFKFYDTIKRIRFVAYMNNLKEIEFAGTACSHEEILEKEVLYSNGSLLFVSDEEDPHFVIVEFVDGSTCLNRINPVKE